MNEYTQQLKATVKNSFFVFVGQNGSTGTPNRITGKMSSYGMYYRFKTKKEAAEFAEENDTGYANCISVPGTAGTLRKYSLGISEMAYYEDLNCQDYK